MYMQCYWFVLYHCRAKKVKHASYQTMILWGKLIALSGTWLYLHTTKFIVLHCTFCKVQRDFEFCSVNHLSGVRVNVNHNATHLPSLAHKNKTDMELKMNLDHSRIIAKEIMIVSGIFVKGGSLPCDNFIITQVVFAKTVSNSPNPLVLISGYANMQNIFYCLNVTGGTAVDVHVHLKASPVWCPLPHPPLRCGSPLKV